MSRLSSVLFPAFLLSLFCLAACLPEGAVVAPGSDSTSGSDEDDALAGGEEEADYPPGPLHPDTLLVEDHPCFEYADVLTQDRRELEFGFSCDPIHVGLEPGRLVVGIEDGGYLRRIEEVSLDGQRAFLVTSEATLAEAVTDVSFEETVNFSERRTIEFSDRVLDESSVEGGLSTVVVERGVLNMDSEITASAKFGFLRVKSVTSRNRTTLGVDLQTRFTTDGPVDRQDIVDLDSFERPFTLRVGPVKVRGTMHSTVRLGFVHQSTGAIDVTTAVEGSGVVEAGGTYTMPDSWNPHWSPEFSGTVTELAPIGAADWNGRVFLLIEGHVSVDGVDSGNSRYELGSDGTVSSDCEVAQSETWAAVSGETTMKLRFMGRSVDHDFPRMDEEVDRRTSETFHAEVPEDCGSPEVTGECSPVAELTCGVPFSGNTATDPLATTSMDAYGCNVGNYEAPELVYQWTAPSSGPVDFALIGATPTELNHDLMVLDGTGGVCSSANCLAQGFNSVGFDAVAGETYFLVVDGYWDQMGPFVAELSCF